MLSFKKLFSYICILLLVFSCATERPSGKTEAEVLYNEAKELMSAGRYLLATERLNQIRSKYSYSIYAPKAELLQADILFAQESYVEAAAAYILYKDFHPKATNLDYVIFRIAESYYQQIPDTYDRDLSAAMEAVKYYEELLRMFRTSKYIEGAIAKIREAKQMVENKEKYIADFYFRTKKYGPARFRYERIVKLFPGNADLRSYAIYKHMESSMLLKEFDVCLNVFNQYNALLEGPNAKLATGIKSKCSKK